MRSVSILSVLVVSSLGGAIGCSGASSGDGKASEDPGTIHLQLTSDGTSGDLLLNGSPANSQYIGRYPNPAGWSSIDVVIHTQDGATAATCTKDGTSSSCVESPFFVEINASSLPFGSSSTGGTSDGTAAGTPSGAAGGTGGGTSDGSNGGTAGSASGDNTGNGTDGPPAGKGGGSSGGTSDGSGAPAGGGGGTGGTSGGAAGGAPAKGSTSDGAPSGGAGSGAGGKKYIHVYDVHGVEIATNACDGGTSGGSGAPSGGTSGGATGGTSGGAPAGSTCGGAAVGGAPGNGGFAKNGTTDACNAASLPDRPGCDGSTVASAAQVYCNAINQQLGGKKLDCSVLTNPNYVPSPLPASRSGGDCSTYWEPASAAVSSSSYGSCEKVTLLLTQWRDRSRHELIAEGVCTSSPLILDLDGDGVHLSGLEDGVSFDLLGAGQKVRAAWTDGKDAFLALDRNGNETIDDATELFGNATGGETYADGFAALGELDDNGDGVIDSRDRAYHHLVLWRDANRDGVGPASEIITLRDAGVKWVGVSAERRDGPSSLDAHGNSIPLVGEFARRDGTHGLMVDAFLRYRP